MLAKLHGLMHRALDQRFLFHVLAFLCNNGFPFLATFLVARILDIDDFEHVL